MFVSVNSTVIDRHGNGVGTCKRTLNITGEINKMVQNFDVLA